MVSLIAADVLGYCFFGGELFCERSLWAELVGRVMAVRRAYAEVAQKNE